jgi:hypothetical protein
MRGGRLGNLSMLFTRNAIHRDIKEKQGLIKIMGHKDIITKLLISVTGPVID